MENLNYHSNISFSALIFKGIDSQKFLQGQIPTNVESLANLHSSISCAAEHTGKVLGIFRLFKVNPEHFVLLVAGATEAKELFTHFKKYSIFSKLELSLIENIGLMVNATAEDAGANPDLAEAGIAFILTNNTLNYRQQVGKKHFSLEVTLEPVTEKNNILLAEYFYQLLINGQLFALAQSQSKQFLPQALGLEDLELAINYKKGCYQGQEGIARAKYRGTNPNCLTVFKLNTAPELVDLIANDCSLTVALGEDRFKDSGTILQKHYSAENNELIIVSVLLKKLAEEEYYLTVNEEKFPLRKIWTNHTPEVKE